MSETSCYKAVQQKTKKDKQPFSFISKSVRFMLYSKESQEISYPKREKQKMEKKTIRNRLKNHNPTGIEKHRSQKFPYLKKKKQAYINSKIKCNGLQEECRARLQYTGTTFSPQMEQKTHSRKTPMPEKLQLLPPVDIDIKTQYRHIKHRHLERERET